MESSVQREPVAITKKDDRTTILDELALAERIRARAIERLAKLAPEAGSGFLLPAEMRDLLRRCQGRLAASEGTRGMGWDGSTRTVA
jgi:hypothetical protein